MQLGAVPLGQGPPEGRRVVDVDLHSRHTTEICTLTSCAMRSRTLMSFTLTRVPLGQGPPEGGCVVDVHLHSRHTTEGCIVTSCTLTNSTLTSRTLTNMSVLGTDVSMLRASLWGQTHEHKLSIG